ncbi:hypothetical protein [Streptomyces antarcticus]|uniref:hypothetical protein n=1 Tax=Streptomyces antarcticus TaxID=2996458 RepID=UPI002271236E|nr:MULTISPECIES: hypothetical protein [unclassified Streptomyces]MCY0945473.1 hypothetical protein [Streptomyces sp. H34-AA3]MCZ4083594.1 hypothetical protein [Streptomyces sp. H34-S5]
MKLNKRLAAVAAAAVVGPTMLMTTPAMADEAVQPAVTVPDTEPLGDAAPAAAAKPADQPAQAPAAQAKQSEVQKPETQKPAGQTASKAAEKASDDAYEQPTSTLMGPEVTVQKAAENLVWGLSGCGPGGPFAMRWQG